MPVERQRVLVPIDVADPASELVEAFVVRDVRETHWTFGRPSEESIGLDVRLPDGRERFYPTALISRPGRAA